MVLRATNEQKHLAGIFHHRQTSGKAVNPLKAAGHVSTASRCHGLRALKDLHIQKGEAH